MAKTVFILAGFKHSAHEKQYNHLRSFFASKGFMVRAPKIHWNNRVMTDYANQFTEYFNAHKTETNVILGFSFGAMIASICAARLKPDKLLLCSLSGYFAEDLKTLKPSWKRWIGKQRLADLSHYKATSIAAKITAPTTIFYGEAEARSFPGLKIRCEETHRQIKQSQLVVVKGAPHKIDYPGYVGSIKSIF